jgi:hypothetical protein
LLLSATATLPATLASIRDELHAVVLRNRSAADQRQAADRDQADRLLDCLSIAAPTRRLIQASIADRYGRAPSVREEVEAERAGRPYPTVGPFVADLV